MARILIVDDEKSIRRTLGEFLRNGGYEVVEAEDADTALQRLREGDFDVVVTDIILPRINGVELLQRIRGTAPYVQVVMMTGEPTVDTARESLRAGAADYLFKPINKEAILRTVATTVRLKALEDAKRRLEAENRAYQENLERLVEERTRQLRASEERARELSRFNQGVLDVLTAHIAVLAEDGTILAVNRGWEDFKAANPPLAVRAGVGANYFSVCEDVVGGDAAMAREAVQGLRAVARGDLPEFSLEYPCHSPDTRQWFVLRATRFAESGRARVVVAHVNITEIKQSEARTAALGRLGFLLGAAHDPVEAGHAVSDTALELWNWDACFVLLYLAEKDQVSELVMFDTVDGQRSMVPGSFTGQNPSPLVRQVFREGRQLILRENSGEPALSTLRFGDTARASLSLMFVPIRNRGANIGVISVQSYRPRAYRPEDLETLQSLADHCAGTLARVQAEAELRHSEERFRTVVEQAPDGIFVQIKQRFAYVNPATLRLFEAGRPEDLIGRPVIERFHPDFRDIASERIRRLNEERLPAPPIEEVCLRMDDSPVHVEVSAVPFTLEDQPGSLAFVRDITERKLAEILSIEQRNLGLALSATDNLGAAVRLCLDAAVRISGMDAGGIYLVHEQTGELELTIHRGLSAEFIRAVSHYAANTANAQKVREGEALHLRYKDLNLPKADVERCEGLRAISVLPVQHEGRVVAVLNVASHRFDEITPVTRHALESVATQIAAVIVRLRAEEALRQSERQLRALSGRLESLREEERTRISREIHDELGQMLTGIRMDLGSMEHDLDAFGEDPRARPVIERLAAATELATDTIKTVQRIGAELRPGILDKLGLAMALQYEVEQFQKRSGLSCVLRLPKESQTMEAGIATTFFRICQEALTNVARHAKATVVEITLRTGAEWFELDVRDNGRGMGGADLSSPASLGLLGMQERARLAGGGITFTTPPEGGTLVALRIPNARIQG